MYAISWEHPKFKICKISKLMKAHFMFSGRVARAGMSGTAYSFVGIDEVAHVIDLHLFLGRSVKLAKHNNKNAGKYMVITSLNAEHIPTIVHQHRTCGTYIHH